MCLSKLRTLFCALRQVVQLLPNQLFIKKKIPRYVDESGKGVIVTKTKLASCDMLH